MRQIHSIPPLFCKDSEKLILGSFPSVKSREAEFFYGHPQNRFWRVISGVYACDIPDTVDEKKRLILDHKLALWDVIASCEITGSSDSSIKEVIPNDIGIILKNSKVKKILVNGKAAEKYYIQYIEPKTNIKAVCMPSTSPANAAFTIQKLTNIWGSELK